MTKAVLLESQYLPNIDYFHAIKQHDLIVIDNEERFVKQTYRNRCKILLSNKVETLSIPVLKSSKGQSIKEIEIDYQQNWIKNHLKGIQSAYGKAPFFEHYFPDISSVLMAKPKHLYELNQKLFKFCLRQLGLKQPIIEVNSANYTPEKYVLTSYKGAIHPKLKNVKSAYKSYYQVFGSEFVSNLSVVDLLFCEGPSSQLFI